MFCARVFVNQVFVGALISSPHMFGDSGCKSDQEIPVARTTKSPYPKKPLRNHFVGMHTHPGRHKGTKQACVRLFTALRRTSLHKKKAPMPGRGSGKTLLGETRSCPCRSSRAQSHPRCRLGEGQSRVPPRPRSWRSPPGAP